ncbi:hypothetical protein WG926_20700 [Tistrella sp. BH-R2-4]|uniref:Transmembrane protein n=1 Tax=Tistrella arctica TaxID=3133430 RepID=A0ABU9YPK3_9PROT
MLKSALSRLTGTLHRPVHVNRPSLQVFPSLDVTRVATELRLEAEGRTRGAADQPPTDSLVPDDMEARVAEEVSAQNNRAFEIYEEQLHTYSERLGGLAFEDRFNEIRLAAPECLSEFRAEAAKGLDELHGLRRHLRETEAERDDFRSRHGLKRVARVHTPLRRGLSIAVIVLLLLIETIANGSFLAAGNQAGLLGGALQALVFAALNIGVAFFLAYWGVSRLAHRHGAVKIVGVLALLLYVILAAVINLALAHYREAAEMLTDGAGREVMRRLIEAPFVMGDIQSWILFGIGLLFSIAAFADGWQFRDPYPGYDGVQTRLDTARAAYTSRKIDLIDALDDIRKGYGERLGEVSRDLSERRKDYDTIIASRQRLQSLFEQSQVTLDAAGTALLRIYRTANQAARTTPPPARFAEGFGLQRIPATISRLDETDREALNAAIRSAQQVLEAGIVEINDAFAQAVEKYRQLDTLVREAEDGTAA